MEELQLLAQSNLRSAKYAQMLLEAFDLDSTNTIQVEKEPTEPDTTPSVDPQNEPEGSVFAY